MGGDRFWELNDRGLSFWKISKHIYIILWKEIHYVRFMICAKFHVVKKIGHEFQSLDTPRNVGITLLHKL